jgi:hypothetical protein
MQAAVLAFNMHCATVNWFCLAAPTGICCAEGATIMCATRRACRRCHRAGSARAQSRQLLELLRACLRAQLQAWLLAQLLPAAVSKRRVKGTYYKPTFVMRPCMPPQLRVVLCCAAVGASRSGHTHTTPKHMPQLQLAMPDAWHELHSPQVQCFAGSVAAVSHHLGSAS